MKISELKKKILKRNPSLELEIKKDLAFQVAKHLEETRLTMGMTQKELAQKINTHQSNIARAEKGDSLPSLSFLKRIAEVGFKTYLISPKFARMETPVKVNRTFISIKTSRTECDKGVTNNTNMVSPYIVDPSNSDISVGNSSETESL